MSPHVPRFCGSRPVRWTPVRRGSIKFLIMAYWDNILLLIKDRESDWASESDRLTIRKRLVDVTDKSGRKVILKSLDNVIGANSNRRRKVLLRKRYCNP